jgi:hypothetical protein
MAYQPAARGGERHFTAGNTRIVTKATDLVENQGMREEFTRNEVWDNEAWKKALLNLFKTKKSYEGRADREKLVFYGQMMHSCIICGGYI